MFEQLDDRMLVQSLRCTKCPACGFIKKPAQTLCSLDYYMLPAAMRKALYNRLGEGYREAVIEALTFLEVTEAKLPDLQLPTRNLQL